MGIISLKADKLRHRDEYNSMVIDCSFTFYKRRRNEGMTINQIKRLIENKPVPNFGNIETQKTKPIKLKTAWDFASYLERLNKSNNQFINKNRLLGEAKHFLSQIGDIKQANYYMVKFGNDVILPDNPIGFKYVLACIKRWSDNENIFYKSNRKKLKIHSLLG